MGIVQIKDATRLANGNYQINTDNGANQREYVRFDLAGVGAHILLDDESMANASKDLEGVKSSLAMVLKSGIILRVFNGSDASFELEQDTTDPKIMKVNAVYMLNTRLGNENWTPRTVKQMLSLVRILCIPYAQVREEVGKEFSRHGITLLSADEFFKTDEGLTTIIESMYKPTFRPKIDSDSNSLLRTLVRDLVHPHEIPTDKTVVGKRRMSTAAILAILLGVVVFSILMYRRRSSSGPRTAAFGRRFRY